MSRVQLIRGRVDTRNVQKGRSLFRAEEQAASIPRDSSITMQISVSFERVMNRLALHSPLRGLRATCIVSRNHSTRRFTEEGTVHMEQTAAAPLQAVHFQSRLWLASRVLFADGNAGESVSTIAPTTTPAASIPLCSACWPQRHLLAYLLATMAVLPGLLFASAASRATRRRPRLVYIQVRFR